MLKWTSVGSLPKRLKGPVLKTGRGRKARESSNLSASAIFIEITPTSFTNTQTSEGRDHPCVWVE